MKRIDETHEKTFGNLPEKVLQIGEGNFLRAFACWAVENANRQGGLNSSVVIAQPIPRGMTQKINEQNSVYTLCMRGVENGGVVETFEKITSVSRCVNPYENYEEFLKIARNPYLETVISNTTEAGIAYFPGEEKTAPPASFPAKLTALLFERFSFFEGNKEKGLLMLPVELIENNGSRLKDCVESYAREWALPEEFFVWLNESCCFASTLVDRIVTGFPAEESEALFARLGYRDELLDTCEPFFFWAIECGEKWQKRFPVDGLGLDIVFSEDITPYRTRKVRILNGAHTVSVLAAYLAGHETVGETVEDELFFKFINHAVFKEIIPTLSLPAKELESFAKAVLERFANPFIKHRLLDISLNSVSKFKARCLPSLLDYEGSSGSLPQALVFGLASLIVFYKGEKEEEGYFAVSNGRKYEIRDDENVLSFFGSAWKQGNAVSAVLKNEELWGTDLTLINGLEEMVSRFVNKISEKGMREAVCGLCRDF